MFDYLKKIIEQVRLIDESVDDYKKLSPSGAMPSVAQVNKALKLLKHNKSAEAETLLLEAAELYPANEAVYRTLGYLYEKRKDFSNAAFYFKKALTLTPIKKDLFLRLGYAQLSAHLNEEALKTFEAGMKIFQLDTEIITGCGMALYRLERYEEARIEFVKAFAIDAHNLNALFLTATIDIMTGDYERAETRLSLLVKVAPNTANLYEYAKLKNLKEDYDAALAFAEKSLSTNKNFLPAYLLIADIYNTRFETQKALDWIQKAEDAELGCDLLYKSRANICMYREDFSAALAAYRKALEFTQEKNIDMQILICEILLGQLEGKEAIVPLITADENNEVAYMLLGVWYYAQGRFTEAESFFIKALRITLKLPVVYYRLAKIYQAQGDDYKTDKYFNIAIEKNPYNFEAHKCYIDYLLQKGNFVDARFKIKKALKLFPDNEYLENLLFHTGFCLLDEHSADYNVKELLKLAEKLEKNSSFLYADEKNVLLEKIHE